MVKRVLVAVLMLCPAVGLPQAPQLLGYQGRLVKTDGTPESGNAQMRFGLFGLETGGSSLWEETQAVSITQGYYSTYLGRMTTFPATLFDTGTLWLEVAVQAPGDTQFRTMTPRQRVGSVAYALNAKSVKGGPVDATSVSVNGTQVIDSNGRLTASAGYSAGAGISIDGTTRAISINSSGCNSGQVLQWNGSAWQCATVSGAGGISGVTGTAPISVMNGTTAPVVSVNVGTTAGTVAAGNDSRFGNATSLGGVAVATTAPTNGQVLQYNGTAWAPADAGTAGISSLTAGTGLTGGTITTTGIIGIAPSGVGSTQLAPGAVTFDKLAATGCAANQVLRYNGSSWACATLAGGNTAAPSLIANFDFEETGMTFNDTSGLGNNATFASGLTAGAVGHTGTGANFSGGFASVAAGNTMPDTIQVHVEAWIWPQSVAMSGAGVIAAKTGGWSLRYLTGAGVSDLDFAVTTRGLPAGCTAATLGASIPVTGWTHVAGFFDGLNVTIAINGAVVARATCPKDSLVPNAGTTLTIGGTATGDRYLGFLDSLRVRSFAQLPVADDKEIDPFPGSTVVTRAQGVRINRWAAKESQRWRLCFRKAPGNNTAAQFHAACDFLGPTVTLLQFNNGRVLGGHSSYSWSGPGGGFYRSYDSNAFLFSVTANKKYPFANYQTETIYNNPSYGPTFGSGHDLFIGGATLDNYYCNFPYAYACNGQVNVNAVGDACAQELCGANRTSTQSTGITRLEVWAEE
jgi:hypothetical protein